MSQSAFREPILAILRDHGGSMRRGEALKGLEDRLAGSFTDADREEIDSGTIRWQKNAEWQVYLMRQEGLLEPVEVSGAGQWELTTQGKAEVLP